MTGSRKNKYHARKCTVDGVVYDSRKEAARGQELRMLEKLGLISDLNFQVPFLLQNNFIYAGHKLRKIEYIADAVYKENGKLVVEDTKSFVTRKNPVYRVKIKLLLFRYPDIIFRENL